MRIGGLHVVLCYTHTHIIRRRHGCCDVRPSVRKVCNSRESDFCFDGVARVVLLSSGRRDGIGGKILYAKSIVTYVQGIIL